jgi:hypothetical protein
MQKNGRGSLDREVKGSKAEVLGHVKWGGFTNDPLRRVTEFTVPGGGEDKQKNGWAESETTRNTVEWRNGLYIKCSGRGLLIGIGGNTDKRQYPLT